MALTDEDKQAIREEVKAAVAEALEHDDASGPLARMAAGFEQQAAERAEANRKDAA